MGSRGCCSLTTKFEAIYEILFVNVLSMLVNVIDWINCKSGKFNYKML